MAETDESPRRRGRFLSGEGNAFRNYRLGGLLLALPIGVLVQAYLWVLQRTTPSALPRIPAELPHDAIVFAFHRDYFSVLAITSSTGWGTMGFCLTFHF